MTPLEQIKERLEKLKMEPDLRLDTYKEGYKGGFNKAISDIQAILPSIIQEVEDGYKEIFEWLLGEKGDFPDLSTPPHYKFRTELRKRLASLKETTVTKQLLSDSESPVSFDQSNSANG